MWSVHPVQPPQVPSKYCSIPEIEVSNMGVSQVDGEYCSEVPALRVIPPTPLRPEDEAVVPLTRPKSFDTSDWLRFFGESPGDHGFGGKDYLSPLPPPPVRTFTVDVDDALSSESGGGDVGVLRRYPITSPEQPAAVIISPSPETVDVEIMSERSGSGVWEQGFDSSKQPKLSPLPPDQWLPAPRRPPVSVSPASEAVHEARRPPAPKGRTPIEELRMRHEARYQQGKADPEPSPIPTPASPPLHPSPTPGMKTTPAVGTSPV
eukprot:Sspe_Gene.40289::Locus_19438_Transcript_1_1_Confidence_1.000_Length_864::g.40289::m.40289